MLPPAARIAPLSLNYLLDFTSQATPESPKQQNKDAFGQVAGGGLQTGQYEYRTYSTISYLNPNWSVGLNWQHLPSIHNAAWVVNRDTPVQGAGCYDLFSLFGTWTINDTLAFRAGVDNLFDRQPEIVGREEEVTNAAGSTVAGFYDLLGRRFYAGVKLNF